MQLKQQQKQDCYLWFTDWTEGNEYVSFPPNVLSVNHVYSQIGASSIVPVTFSILNIKSF